MGHKSTHVTETVCRKVIVPAIRGGATVMDGIFTDRATEPADAADPENSSGKRASERAERTANQ